jgi:hypothetical protein
MHLQKNLDAVYEWCVTNKLLLNISKCNVMTYARKMNPLFTVYKINGSMLEKPDSIRDLGVSFNSTLSFNDHIDLVAQSAFKSLGFIMRNSREIFDADTLKTLYVT